MQRLIQQLLDAGGTVCATFDPHRCTPDGRDTAGNLIPREAKGMERIHAVLEAGVALYPSPHPQRVGCIEVRYVGTSDAGEAAPLTSRNERFIDYGPVEALTYARFAASVGDAARLSPRTLACVDPQAFWAACLRVDDFVAALAELEAETGAALVSEWQPLADGMKACVAACRRGSAGFVAWDAHGTWDGAITSPERHAEIAEEGLFAGMLMSMDRAKAHAEAHPHLKTHGGPLCYQILDDMRATKHGKVLNAIVTSGGDGHRMNSALEAAGFGRDALGLADNPLTSCGACHTTVGHLRKCSGCGGQVYCSAACQKAHWPTHKKSCSKVIAQMRANFCDMAARGFEPPQMQMSQADTSAARLPQCVLTEASGVGGMSIFWNPGSKSIV